MGWQTIFKADTGLFRDLQNTDLENGNYSYVNNYAQYSTGEAQGPCILTSSGNLSVTEIATGTWKTLFGFMLKRNGVFENEYAVLRVYAQEVEQSTKACWLGLRWQKWNSATNTYTDISNYSTTVGNSGMTWMNWPPRIKIGFKKRLETYSGVLQYVLYGGVEINCQGSGSNIYYCALQGLLTKSQLSGYDEIDITGEDTSPEFGPESDADGYGQSGVIGTHDKHSDHVGIPSKPQYGFTSAGFLNHYRISPQGLSMLGEALFPEPQSPSIDILSAIDRLCVNMYNSKLVDYIIDCRIIPVVAPAANMVNITCGGKVLLHPTSQQAYSAYLVDEDFVDVDCGMISTPLTEGCFLDFVTRAKIFIPFYGFVDLAPEYWHGAKIGLYYRFNLMDGSFMTWLTSAPFRSEMESSGDMEIIGQYAGNACIHLPINSQSYSQIIGGMITTGAAIVGAAAAGAIGGAAAKTAATTGAVQTAISGAANIANGRPQLINNNSYNGSAALMSCRTPYLLIEFSEAQFSRRYVDENGLPAIINRVLGTMSGFTSCVNPIIDFACEEEEAEEIRRLLKSGVIL